MRIVIAGGTGLIGRNLANNLSEDDHEVVVLSRDPSGKERLFSDEIHVVQWSTDGLGKWSQQIDGADAVVNFAGENIAGNRLLPGRWTEAKKRNLVKSRVDAGTAIRRSIESATTKPKLLVQASAVGFYGPCGDELVTETSSPGSDFLANLCLDWEKATDGVEEHGVRRVILRTGLVLSNGGGPLPRLINQYRLLAGGTFGNGKQWWPWIHLDDVIGSIRYLMADNAARGPFNITSPTPETNVQFNKKLGKALHRPSFWPIPGFAVRLLVGEVAVVVLEGQKAVPQKLTGLGYSFKFDRLDAALSNIFGP